jgi:hypothetical protein
MFIWLSRVFENAGSLAESAASPEVTLQLLEEEVC